MAAYSTTQLRNGHTLTIVCGTDGPDAPFMVQERNELGTFLHNCITCRSLSDASAWVEGAVERGYGLRPTIGAGVTSEDRAKHTHDAFLAHRISYSDAIDSAETGGYADEYRAIREQRAGLSGDHSASRNVETLQAEAPHLIAPATIGEQIEQAWLDDMAHWTTQELRDTIARMRESGRAFGPLAETCRKALAKRGEIN